MREGNFGFQLNTCDKTIWGQLKEGKYLLSIENDREGYEETELTLDELQELIEYLQDGATELVEGIYFNEK